MKEDVLLNRLPRAWGASSKSASRTPGVSQRATPARCRRAVRQLRTIAVKEFSDRLRSGWVVGCVVVWLGAIGLTSFLGLLQIGRIGVQGYERTVSSLLNLVQYLVPLLGLLLGHDLVVGEREEGTLRLALACGMPRPTLVLGKFIGGFLTICVPLLLGFMLAGAAIGLAAHDAGVAPFLRLAASSLVLGAVFVGVGLSISCFSRTRVQSLVFALLTWGIAVFGFDLMALGILVSTKEPTAAKEIDIVCDATHLNTTLDLHSGFDDVLSEKPRNETRPAATSLNWLVLNPVDLFRVVNLGAQLDVRTPAVTIIFSVTLWLACTLGLSLWKLRRIDL